MTVILVHAFSCEPGLFSLGNKVGTVAFCSVIGDTTRTISDEEAGRLRDMIGFLFDGGFGPMVRELSMGKGPVVEGGNDGV